MKKAAIILSLFLGFSCLACNRSAPDSASKATTPNPTTVLIVRHAEKASEGDNPPLTEAGLKRAQGLVRVVQDADIKAIYTTQLIRSRDTAKPLADRLGISITEMAVNPANVADYGKTLAKELLDKHKGKTVLVVSHTNIMPALIEALSGKAIEPISDPDYDNLFIVTIPANEPARLIKAQYGLEQKTGSEMQMKMGK